MRVLVPTTAARLVSGMVLLRETAAGLDCYTLNPSDVYEVRVILTGW